MSELEEQIGATIRAALEKQFRQAGRIDEAEVMHTELDEGLDAQMGRDIIEAHEYSTEGLRQSAKDSSDTAKAYRQIAKILERNPQASARLVKRFGVAVPDALQEMIEDAEVAKKLMETLAHIEQPARQNTKAARVAFSIAELFRAYGLVPSAAKLGPAPSSIFGQCVQDVLRLLGDTTDWRRVSEAAVSKGTEYTTKQKVFSKVLGWSLENVLTTPPTGKK